METKKSKPHTEKPKLKVMHTVSKDGNGAPTITSTVKNAPKVKETVDVQHGHKAVATVPKTVSKTEMSDEQRSVLKGLNDLGGKDIHIAKKLGFDKKYPDAPRAPVRNAMGKLHSLHFVSSKKVGMKYAYSITEKGVEALKNKPANHTVKTEKDTGTNPVTDPSPTGSISSIQPPLPANTGVQCSMCGVFNPFMAVHCKECGTQLQPVQAAPVAA